MGPAAAAVEIQWWHAMQNELKRLLDKLASDFNETQPEYKIVPANKGLYNETLSAAIVALRSRQQPAIVQVAEVATATMMAAKGAVYPVYELMRDQGEGVQPEGLSAGGHRLLHRRLRQHAVVSVQRLDPDPLLQQGLVPLRRARPGPAAQNLAGGGAGRPQAALRRRALRFHHALAVVDP